MKKLVVICFLLLISQSLWAGFMNNKILYEYKGAKLSAPILSNVLLIRYKPTFSATKQKAIGGISSDYTIIDKFLDESQKIRNRANNFSEEKLKAIESAEEPLLRTFIIEYKRNMHPIDYARKLLKENYAIEIAEPYYIYQTLAAPNDPMFIEQSVFETIRAVEAYNISIGSEDIVIGISDNGTDQSHPDLAGNIAENQGEIAEDGIDNDGNGYVDDFIGYNFAYLEDGHGSGITYNYDSHGTEVAGIAGAHTNNGIGIAGVGYNCKIFPLKCATLNDPGSIKYGYQSIIYAAIRGFKVINCSWGSIKPYSQLEQSIIDFAVANDLAVVAAAGNVESGKSRYDDFYPGAYRGVLSVGETDKYDKVNYSNTSLSPKVRIMAQGIGNLTTNINGSYVTVSSGTSYSSPVVAGALGVVRSYFPHLSARQAQEWVRVTADDISSFNYTDTKLIPGRLNLYNALSGDPMSSIAVSLESYETSLYRDGESQKTDRFGVNDTISLKLTFKNHLADAGNLTFKLSVAYSLVENCQIIDSVQHINFVSSDEVFTLPNFSFMVLSPIVQRYVFRVDIENEDGTYRDFAKIPFFFGKEVTTFSNDVLTFSVSDQGTFGFDRERKNGSGFESHQLGNHLYRGGLMATANNSIAFNSIYSFDYSGNDFSSVKPFYNPNNIGKVAASRALTGTISDVVGVEISSEFEFPHRDKPVIRNKLTYKNVGNVAITDPALGYFYDWDVGLYPSNNYAKLFSEAVPPKYWDKQSAAAEYAFSPDENVYVGSIAYSDNDTHIGQAAALNMDEISWGFGQSKQVQALSSGQSLQFPDMTDIAFVIGMNFKTTLQPGEEQFCYICTAISDSKESLALLLKQCADSTYSSVSDKSFESDISLYPNPANDYLYIDLSKLDYPISNISLISILGEEQSIIAELSGKSSKIDISNIPNGNYLLKIQLGDRVIIKKIAILK